MAIRANNIELISGSVGELGQVSSSQRIGTIKTDPNDSNSFMISSSQGGDLIYLSGSGRIGFNTDDPQSGLDAVVDEVQFQRPGTRKGLKINNEGNIESFDSDPLTASTGSEFVLRFSRGTAITQASLAALGITVSDDTAATAFFNALKDPDKNAILEKLESVGFIDPAQVGDTLGAIRWVSDSGSIEGFNDRTTGETAVIKAIVSDGDATGIQADMIFSVAGKTGAAEQKFLIDAGNQHQITGSLNVLGSIRTSGFIQPRQSENSQTRIDFSNSGVDIDFYSNTSQVLKLSNTGVVFNEPSNDIDFRIESNDDTKAFYINAGINAIQLGSAATTHVTASGNISASGTITALSSNIVTINGGSF